MATVTCTKECYFYRGSTLYEWQTYTESGLTPGLTYTPSAHMPSYNSNIYTTYMITCQGIEYTTGSMTCPSSNFTVYYYFYATVVTCTNYYYFYRGTNLVSSSSSTDTLIANYSYTPSAHMPSYDNSVYTSYGITYNGSNYTTGSFITPSYDFSIDYNFYGNASSSQPSLSIDKWSWTGSNGSASASQTQAAYSAITNMGKLSDFSYLVWNDMVDKVMEILDAAGESWNTLRASYTSTRMSSSDKILTATRFNSLRYNIGLHYSTGITDFSKGDIIYGQYFVTLANCINGWIDSL